MDLKENSSLDSKVLIYQERYNNLIEELNSIKEKLKISKTILAEVKERYTKIDSEYTQIQELVEQTSQKNINLRNTYINKKKEQIYSRIFSIAVLLGFLIGIIFMRFYVKTALINSFIGGIGFSFFGAAFGGIFYNKKEPKITSRLYSEYKNSEEYEMRTKIIDERLTLRKAKDNEWLAISKEYKEAKENYKNLLETKNDKIQEIVSLRNELLSLIFPNEMEELKHSQFIMVIPNLDTDDEYSKEETDSFVKAIKPKNIV